MSDLMIKTILFVLPSIARGLQNLLALESPNGRIFSRSLVRA